MATRSVSPGGALLRASRLFSIPAPLARPTAELASTVIFNSDTATSPHPTHLTITTPPSSLSKGDWGLKRPLPLRSTTKTSTPFIRVESVDTLEHITEYASAADHTLTLQKWQELNMPLSTPGIREQGGYISNKRTGIKGVFEENLVAASNGLPNPAKQDDRWKFSGPWLAGLTEGEFDEYVRKTVRGRKVGFQQFLKENKALEDTKTAQRKAAEEGIEQPPAINASDITDEQLRGYLRVLRQDRGVLFGLLRRFLDLPPAPSSKGFLAAVYDDLVDSMGTGLGSKVTTLNSEDFSPGSTSQYAETGPPKTHPSAGLSYLRSKSYIYNHPVYGPQERPPPVEGRIILPKNASIGSFAPRLGVAGVVTNVPVGDGFNISNMQKAKHGQIRKETNPGLVNIEPDKVGGSKVYLHPHLASFDQSGRINFEVLSGDGPARAILEGKENEIHVEGRLSMKPIKPLPRPPSTTSRGYGLEPGDFPATGRRSKGPQRKGSDDASEAMKTLKSLLDSTSAKY